jgi:hypothetical protein
MGTFLHNTQTEHELEAGKSDGWFYDISTERVGAVWSVNAMPVPSGDTESGFNEVVSLEVTKVWRKMSVAFVGDEIGTLEIQHQLGYEVKNVGNETAKFVIVLAAIT